MSGPEPRNGGPESRDGANDADGRSGREPADETAGGQAGAPPRAAATSRRTWVVFAPLAVFVALALVFAVRLIAPDDGQLPSTLAARAAPAPEFVAPPLRADGPGIATADLASGAPVLFNVWASWCGPCRYEHPVLMRLRELGVRVFGLNYKDEPDNARAFLDELGDPFDRVGVDANGRIGIEWGVYGVPETFVVAGDGAVIYRHVGPMSARDVEDAILPALEKARARTATQ